MSEVYEELNVLRVKVKLTKGCLLITILNGVVYNENNMGPRTEP